MRAPGIWLLAMLAVSPAAQADLYRWIDPQSGSVKYSSLPPPWYGDAERERRSPAVEVIPYQAPGAVPLDREKGKPLAALEARWRSFLRDFSTLAAKEDFERAGRGIEQQLHAYRAVVVELNRQDPAGAARRRAEETSVMEKLQKGLEAQFSPASPVAR